MTIASWVEDTIVQQHIRALEHGQRAHACCFTWWCLNGRHGLLCGCFALQLLNHLLRWGCLCLGKATGHGRTHPLGTAGYFGQRKVEALEVVLVVKDAGQPCIPVNL